MKLPPDDGRSTREPRTSEPTTQPPTPTNAPAPTPSQPPTQPAVVPVGDGPKPVAIDVDGQNAHKIRVPDGFFDPIEVENLLKSEFSRDPDGRPNRAAQYPREPLDRFFADRWDTFLRQLIAYVERRWPDPNATGYAMLDYEDALTLEAWRADGHYKQGLTDEQYEALARRFFIESIRACRAVRPGIKWTIWFQPNERATREDVMRNAEFYRETDWLAISIYDHYRFRNDAERAKDRVDRRGERVQWVREIHPKGKSLEAVAFTSGHYQGAMEPTPPEEIVKSMKQADDWATFYCVWLPSGQTADETAAYQRSILPGGHIYEAIRMYREGFKNGP